MQSAGRVKWWQKDCYYHRRTVAYKRTYRMKVTSSFVAKIYLSEIFGSTARDGGLCKMLCMCMLREQERSHASHENEWELQ
jgi:hypothetical protein